jgi:hypothetical protein
MVKLQMVEATPIMNTKVKKVLTLRIFMRMGYDISTATVSLMLIRMKVLPYY